MPDINLYNTDCVEFMKSKPDKYYSLAVVDPPYGGGGGGDDDNAFSGKKSRFGGNFDRYGCREWSKKKVTRTGGTWSEKYQNDEDSIKFWDYAPTKEYFDELFRVSENQIIWGGNYFGLPPNRCFLIWRKLTISDKFSMAMAEYAWTSFNENAKVFECAPQGTVKDPRFHPTQKPVALYEWIFDNYASKGMRILDTHGGSMSSAVAAYNMGIDIDVCEINKVYFEKARKRLDDAMKQGILL